MCSTGHSRQSVGFSVRPLSVCLWRQIMMNEGVWIVQHQLYKAYVPPSDLLRLKLQALGFEASRLQGR